MPINGQSGRNGLILRKVHPSKTDPRRNRKYARLITNTEIKAVTKKKKILQQTKAQAKMVSQENSTKSTKHLEMS